MDRKPLRLAILEGERVLTAAGIPSARAEAEMLAAHLLGVERTKLMMFPLVDQSVVDSLEQLVQRRASRIPLQHLTGTAAFGRVTLAVGPGVFVPRPETEQLLEWALNRLRGLRNPVVVDLCAGSGGIALALAHERPDAEVLAVENDPTALTWARGNAERRRLAGDTPVHVLEGDVTDHELLAERAEGVDLLVCNPPYVPEGTPVPPEVGDHDPPAAVFAGRDGLEVLRHVVAQATRLLSPGGGIAVEHDDTHGGSVPALLAARPALTDVRAHNDLAGRPRFATARHDSAEGSTNG